MFGGGGSFPTAQHLNCALAPGLQFDTLELQKAVGVVWLESHRSHVQIVRNILRCEDGYEQLHVWRGQEFAFRPILGQKQWFSEVLEI